MIHAVRFRNFKALRDVAIQLERFTVLVGANASGKSSVLEGIHHLTRLAATEPRKVFRGSADVGVLASRGATGVFELTLDGSFRGKRGRLSVGFASIEDYPFTDTYRLEASLEERRYSFQRELHRPTEAGEAFPAPGELPLSLVLREAALLEFDRRRLAAPAYSDLPTPLVAPHGDGLAAVIADMAVARPDDFQRLQEALRAVIPGLSRVRLVRARVPTAAAPRARTAEATATPEAPERVSWGHEIVLDMKGATDIPARAASEGTLLLLGLFAALIGPERHRLVLIDHLERAVSPRGMGAFVAQLNEILRADPQLQIVATSDSPLLLDHLRAEQVRVHAILPDGSVAVAGLHEHPDYTTLREDLLPGEFWRELGDEWVTEPRQPPSKPPPEPPIEPPLETAPPPPKMPTLPKLPEPSEPPASPESMQQPRRRGRRRSKAHR
jgi:predicted ATPase